MPWGPLLASVALLRLVQRNPTYLDPVMMAKGFSKVTQTTVKAQKKKMIKSEYAQFYEYLCNAEATFHVQVAYFNGMRGLRAAKNFQPGDEIMRIPRSIILDDNRAAACSAVSGLWAARDHVPAFAKLALLILYEIRRSHESSHRPYLDMLPTREDFDAEGGPLSLWTPEEMELLECPKLACDKAIRDELFSDSGALSMQYLSSEWDRLQLVGRAPTESEMRWAVAAVTSRAYGAKEQNGASTSMLIPMVDMANHAHPSNTVKGLDDDGSVFVVLAAKSIDKGEEVFLSYGSLPNIVLLPQFGFVMRNAVNDVALVHCPEVAAAATELEHNDITLPSLIRDKSNGFISEWQPAGSGLRDALDVLASNDALPLLGSDYANTAPRAVYASIIKRTMAAFSGSVGDDAALLKLSDLQPRARLAITFRSEQKSLLNREFATL